MSTIQEANCGIISAIVRGYRDRPVRLKARLCPGGSIEVFRHDPTKWIGWPVKDAYQDDPATMSRLQSAWESGDEHALEQAWARAKPLEQSATNR